MNKYNVLNTVKIQANTITIPERIEYPQIRLTIDPNIISANDIVALTVSVYDSTGVEKYNDGYKVRLNEFPTSKNIGVGGVAKLTLMEQTTTKSEAVVGGEEIIKG